MILMPQIFKVIANENARYKRNELEMLFAFFVFLTNQRVQEIETKHYIHQCLLGP